MFFLFLCAIATLSTPAQSAPSPEIASNASRIAEMSLTSSARRLLSDSATSSPPPPFTNPCQTNSFNQSAVSRALNPSTSAPTGDDALFVVLYLTASLLIGIIFGLIIICILAYIRQRCLHANVAIQPLPPRFGPGSYADVTGAYIPPVGAPPLTRPLYTTSVPSLQILIPGTSLPSFLAWPATPSPSPSPSPSSSPSPNTPGGDPSTYTN